MAFTDFLEEPREPGSGNPQNSRREHTGQHGNNDGQQEPASWYRSFTTEAPSS